MLSRFENQRSGLPAFRAEPEVSGLGVLCVAVFVAIGGTLAVDALRPGVRKSLLHRFDVGRDLLKLLGAPVDLLSYGGEPVKDQRPVAVAPAGDFSGPQPLPVVEVEDLDEGSFSQAFVGIEGCEQLDRKSV